MGKLAVVLVIADVCTVTQGAVWFSVSGVLFTEPLTLFSGRLKFEAVRAVDSVVDPADVFMVDEAEGIDVWRTAEVEVRLDMGEIWGVMVYGDKGRCCSELSKGLSILPSLWFSSEFLMQTSICCLSSSQLLSMVDAATFLPPSSHSVTSIRILLMGERAVMSSLSILCFVPCCVCSVIFPFSPKSGLGSTSEASLEEEFCSRSL